MNSNIFNSIILSNEQVNYLMGGTAGINRLMSMIPNWKRSDQEKVKGLHPAYCDKTGRTKHPWVRVDAPSEDTNMALPTEQDLPF